jgi:hypothetical protein
MLSSIIGKEDIVYSFKILFVGLVWVWFQFTVIGLYWVYSYSYFVPFGSCSSLFVFVILFYPLSGLHLCYPALLPFIPLPRLSLYSTSLVKRGLLSWLRVCYALFYALHP